MQERREEVIPDTVGMLVASEGSGGWHGEDSEWGHSWVQGSPWGVGGHWAVPGMCGDTCEPPGCKGTLASPGPGLGGVDGFVTLLQVAVGAGGPCQAQGSCGVLPAP